MTTAILSLCVVSLTAGPLNFSGSSSIYSEYGWVSGDTLVRPRPELRFNVNPSLSLWGFPIGLDILLSTQESPLRQQLDKFKLFLNPKKWLESQDDLSGLALSFKGLELGSCNPSLSPLVLSGQSVLGGAIEFAPWYYYLAATAGRSQRAIDGADTTDPAYRMWESDTTDPVYSRMLYAAKTGFGKKERTHFYLTGMYVADDSNALKYNGHLDTVRIDSVTLDTTWTETAQTQENYVLGAEFNLNLYDGGFTLESEIAGSELTRDNRLPVEHWDWLPDWAANTFKPRMSSSVDYAFKVRPAANLLDTRVYAKFEFVGSGYQSLGAPGLRNDNTVVGAGIERGLFNRSVTASFAYNQEHDNLLRQKTTWTDTVVVGSDTQLIPMERVLSLKSSTTRFTNWEANLGVAFPNLPYLQVGYYPYTQSSDSLDSMANVALTRTTAGKVVSVSAGHSFQTGEVSHSPGISFSYNDVRGPVSDSADNTSWDASLNYGLGFESPLSLSASCGYSRSDAVTAAEPDSRLYFDLSPSYTLFEKWSHSLSVGGTFGSATRIDARYSTSFPIWKICDASVSVIDAVYNGDDGKYNDLRLTAQLSKSW